MSDGEPTLPAGETLKSQDRQQGKKLEAAEECCLSLQHHRGHAL